MHVREQGDRDPTVVARPGDTYEALFADCFLSMVRLATLLGADDAENIAQEAFVSLHLRYDRLNSPAAARAYLRTTVTNLTRKRHRHLTVVRRHQTPTARAAASAEDAAFPTGDDDATMRVLRALPPRQREAIVLRYWLDLGERDIADAMRVTVGSVKAHISRGLAALRTSLPDPKGNPS